MNPWRRFERALQTMEEPGPELRKVLRDLAETAIGSEADRTELRASTTAMLAYGGDLPLADAIAQVRRAREAGRPGWPNLYLAMAALRTGDPATAVEAVSDVPDGYFDDMDLHWRSLQVLSLEAEARICLGQDRTARTLIRQLNLEFRGESPDEMSEPPVPLVQRLLDQGPPYPLLAELVAGVDLAALLGPELAAAVEGALRGEPRPWRAP